MVNCYTRHQTSQCYLPNNVQQCCQKLDRYCTFLSQLRKYLLACWLPLLHLAESRSWMKQTANTVKPLSKKLAFQRGHHASLSAAICVTSYYIIRLLYHYTMNQHHAIQLALLPSLPLSFAINIDIDIDIYKYILVHHDSIDSVIEMLLSILSIDIKMRLNKENTALANEIYEREMPNGLYRHAVLLKIVYIFLQRLQVE